MTDKKTFSLNHTLADALAEAQPAEGTISGIVDHFGTTPEQAELVAAALAALTIAMSSARAIGCFQFVADNDSDPRGTGSYASLMVGDSGTLADLSPASAAMLRALAGLTKNADSVNTAVFAVRRCALLESLKAGDGQQAPGAAPEDDEIKVEGDEVRDAILAALAMGAPGVKDLAPEDDEQDAPSATSPSSQKRKLH